MALQHYDLAVIGSGPAGQKGAIAAAKLGKKVALIEGESLGGACLNSGTIPSKSLREAILEITRFYEKSFYGRQDTVKNISINDLNYRLHIVLEMQKNTLTRQLKKNRVDFLLGKASFINPHLLRVLGETVTEVKADVVLIASGSKPRNPQNIPFDDQYILDSTRLLSIDSVPESLVVLGGGVIGAEYASFFAALGSKVTVVDKKERMLPYLDREIGIHFSSAVGQMGLCFMGSKQVTHVTRSSQGASISFQEGQLEANKLLYALGRIANVEGLNVEGAGIKLENGYIPVNKHFQTCQANIYAAGDVIGSPALASTSMEQGRLAVYHAFHRRQKDFPLFCPIGIYTIPEISFCGKTEEQLQILKVNYEVGRAYYYEVARGQIAGDQCGMFKILFHRETLEILGVHIIGRAATELIHIGQIAMTFKASIDYFIDQVFNYPTYAEGYRIAALNGLNKLPSKGG